MRTLVIISLLLSLPASKLVAQKGESETVQVSMALLSLAPDHGGRVVIGTGEHSSDPMQLSTRYFSRVVKAKMGEGRRINLYFPAVNGEDDTAKPLSSIVVPVGCRRVYVALTPGKNAIAPYKALVIPSSKMPIGSMMLMNSTGKPIGLKLEGNKPQQIKPRSFLMLKAKSPSAPQAVEILTPSKKDKTKWKTVFSSKWYIAARHREFCIIYPSSHGGGVRVRSLFEKSVRVPTQ